MSNYIILPNGDFITSDELYHWGIKGMKWGVRRYQNADGTLTAAGKKHQAKLIASNREATISKGTTLYRVSDRGESDTSSDKIYVSTSKETGDFYINKLGSNKIYQKGKAYAHEYISKTDIKMPDRKTMEKIELGLLKDKKVQEELVDSLMKKGMSREQATANVAPYNAGKAFIQKAGVMSMGTLYGAFGGAYTGLVASGANPLGIAIGAGAGAAVGATSGAVAKSPERTRALNTARVSYGDKNNKTINSLLENELSKRGYNAVKDYNDRRAFGDKGKEAIVVFNSKDNIKSTKISEVKSKDYGEAYARNYLKEHPNSKLSFDDLVKDGEDKYKRLYESGVIAREREKENKRLLEQAKNS